MRNIKFVCLFIKLKLRKGDDIMIKFLLTLTTENNQTITWKKYYYEIVKAMIIYK